MKEYNKQKAEFDALAAGPIYQAGVAEWMAQSDVTNALAAFNTAVGMASTALTALDALQYASFTVDEDGMVGDPVSKYVPLVGTELITAATDGMGMVGTVARASQLRQRGWYRVRFGQCDDRRGHVYGRQQLRYK